MKTTRPYLLLLAILSILAVRSSAQMSSAQAPHMAQPRPVVPAAFSKNAFQAKKFLEQSSGMLRTRPNTGAIRNSQPTGAASTSQPAAASHISPMRPAATKTTILSRTPVTLGAPTCTDTTGHILTTEATSWVAPGPINLTHDNDILVPGWRESPSNPFYVFPYLVKQTPQGSIVWSRSFNGLGVYPLNYADADQCFELADGTLLMTGDLSVPEPYNGAQDMVVWHLDATGNLLWVRTDSSTLWQEWSGYMFVTSMIQDQAGNIYLAGDMDAWDSRTSHTFVLEMDPSGNIVWDQSFENRLGDCYGMFWVGNQLSVVGLTYNDNNASYLWNMRLDPASGNMLSLKACQTFDPANPNMQYGMFFARGSAKLLSNGNISVAGTAFSDAIQTTNIIHGVVAEFDPNFNYLQGWMVKSNVQSNFYNTVFTQHPSGRISYTYLNYITGYDGDIDYGAIENGQIVKERILHQRNRADAWNSNFLNPAPDEDIILEEFATATPVAEGSEFVRLHDSDTSSVCSGHDSAACRVEPLGCKPYGNPYWTGVYSNTFRIPPHTMPAPVDGTPGQTAACSALASCNTIQLVADQSQVCAGSPVTFTLLRNSGCGASPVWTFDTTNIQSIETPSDTTLQLTYRDHFQGNITATMTGTCSNLSEAQPLTVLPAAAGITLSAPTYLCPDSTLTLRPQSGYVNYVWQDGSTADTFLVTTPGTYTVSAATTCGTSPIATVIIQQAPLASFSAGPDATACLGTPVALQATSGFQNYSWTDVTGSSLANTQSITVTPPSTTQYIASAKTSLGCGVTSTVDITVTQPLPVELGDDTSFCKGDSVFLDAGAGFSSYLWSSGATTQTIVAYQAGVYSVKALSPNGCYGGDTLRVLQIYLLPQPKLDPATWLCVGASRVLAAGSGYSSYLWQDGSTQPTLQIDTTGTYWVQVVDANGCTGRDTVAIVNILGNPTGFLVQDTVICNGYPSTIAARGGYISYNWSNGESTPEITVEQAGDLSLTVTDQYGCSGTADIAITTKQCLFGIYFANAFTPDGSSNALFRPYVLGNMLRYHLQIFNRWGALVFSTEDYTRGWDGTIGGTPEPPATYVWMCRYQFAGETQKLEKGTLLLIR
ncbi:MAG TPA: gliding motility-associated C-terminal domain-containing protein [Puia sp.]|nr:gliding motility-associated C-terminal domain-containing protein [Puia sp.]